GRFPAELHFHDAIAEAELLQAVHDRPTDAGAVDKQHGNFAAAVRLLKNVGGKRDQPHGIAGLLTRNANGLERRRVWPATETEDTIITPSTGDIQSTHEGLVGQWLNTAFLSVVDPLCIDVLEVRSRWWQAAHAYSNKVGVFAIVLNPFCNLRLVRELAFPTIHHRHNVAVALAAEARPMKRALAARRVAEEKLHRLAVGQAAFLNLVDLVGHGRVFVVDVEARRVRRVLAGESFGVLFPAGLRRAEPALLMAGVVHAVADHAEP